MSINNKLKFQYVKSELSKLSIKEKQDRFNKFVNELPDISDEDYKCMMKELRKLRG